MGNRSTRPTRAKLDDAACPHIRQPAAKTFRESPPVGVVTYAASLRQHDGVHGTDGARFVGQFMQQREHRLLAGISNVQTHKTLGLRVFQQISQRFRTRLQLLEVDQPVFAAQTLFGSLVFMHGWRARCLDAGADQANQIRRSGGILHCERFTSKSTARILFCWIPLAGDSNGLRAGGLYFGLSPASGMLRSSILAPYGRRPVSPCGAALTTRIS